MKSFRYFPQTKEDIGEMLGKIGVRSLDELFADVPEELKTTVDLGTNSDMAEQELMDELQTTYTGNKRMACLAGDGTYDKYIPAAIAPLARRSEFLTAYTPYQAEISQGTLQYIFEWQTIMCRLTGMDVANASMYDGATATAEAMIMAISAAKKANRILVSSTMRQETIDVVKTYAHYRDIEIVEIASDNGVTSKKQLEEEIAKGGVAGVIVQQPNANGIVEDYSGFADMAHNAGALFAMNYKADSLAVLKTPREWGADIAVGDAQTLGLHMSMGGPHLGYMCTTTKLMRKMPGRIVGMTRDNRGQRCYALTLQAREQHIRRQKATSNICSNQSNMVLQAVIYTALMGKEGLKEAAEKSYAAAHYLYDQLLATGKFTAAYPDTRFFNEFVVEYTGGDINDLTLEAENQGILLGMTQGNTIQLAATENTRKKDIDKWTTSLK